MNQLQPRRGRICTPALLSRLRTRLGWTPNGAPTAAMEWLSAYKFDAVLSWFVDQRWSERRGSPRRVTWPTTVVRLTPNRVCDVVHEIARRVRGEELVDLGGLEASLALPGRPSSGFESCPFSQFGAVLVCESVASISVGARVQPLLQPGRMPSPSSSAARRIDQLHDLLEVEQLDDILLGLVECRCDVRWGQHLQQHLDP